MVSITDIVSTASIISVGIIGFTAGSIFLFFLQDAKQIFERAFSSINKLTSGSGGIFGILETIFELIKLPFIFVIDVLSSIIRFLRSVLKQKNIDIIGNISMCNLEMIEVFFEIIENYMEVFKLIGLLVPFYIALYLVIEIVLTLF